MIEGKLHQDLQRLRTEVQRVANNDVAARDELNRIIGDIERHMEEPGDASEHHGLLDQMRVAIRRFETEHPRATAILNDIMVTLSNMGI
jgi:hypothetical protein